jgi:hypothetical protein
MANACDIWLTITGPEVSRTQLLEEVGGDDNYGNWMPIDFQKVLPVDWTGGSDEIIRRQLSTWGAYGYPSAYDNTVLDDEGAADQTVVRLATSHVAPVAIFSTLAARYPALTFELVYLLEWTAGAGYMRWTAGKLEHEEVADGVEATLALLDRIRPELGAAEREIYGH